MANGSETGGEVEYLDTAAAPEEQATTTQTLGEVVLNLSRQTLPSDLFPNGAKVSTVVEIEGRKMRISVADKNFIEAIRYADRENI